MAKAAKKDEKPKKQQTVRQRTQSSDKTKSKRIRQTAGRASSPFKKAHRFGKREYHLVKLPDNKAGRILSKRVKIFPKFVREAWAEVKLVTWPNANETWRLTVAVFIFAVVFATIVGLIDFGLDKLFREVIVGR